MNKWSPRFLLVLNRKIDADPRTAMYQGIDQAERDRRRARGKAQRRSRKINRRR